MLLAKDLSEAIEIEQEVRCLRVVLNEIPRHRQNFQFAAIDGRELSFSEATHTLSDQAVQAALSVMRIEAKRQLYQLRLRAERIGLKLED